MIKRLLQLTSFLVLSIVLMGAGPVLPPTATEMEKLRYLAAVKEYIPGLFDNATAYKVNLLDLLDKQQELVNTLNKVPEFQKNAGQRPLIKVTLEPDLTEKKILNQEAVADWKEGLQHQLGTLQSADISSEIKTRLQTAAKEMGQGTSQGFMTGLIKLVPVEKSRTIFSMGREQQLEQLELLLPEDLSASGFRGEQYGVPTEGLTKKKVLDVLTKKIAAENTFFGMAELQFALQDQHGKLPTTIQEANSIIEGISEEKIHALSAQKELGEVSKEAAKLAAAKFDQSLKSFFTKAQANSLLTKPISLTEVPPSIGIFRGYMGGDCSSSFSFGYPWGPNERTFMIHGSDGTLKGYLSSVIVKGDLQELNLYIHTINGSKISNSEAKAIIQGMSQIKEQLGVKSIVMPSVNLFSINNYEAVRSAIQALSKGTPEVPLNYFDQYSRDHISKVASAAYDRPESNPKGIPYKERTEIQPLKVTITESPVHLVPKDITTGEAALIALDFKKISQDEMAERIIKAVNLKPADLNWAYREVTNPEKKPTEQFIHDLKTQFAKLQVTVDEDFLKRKYQLVGNGFLAAPDALNVENQKRTKILVFDQLELPYPSPEAYDIMSRNPQLFASDPKTMVILKRSMFDDQINLDKVAQVQSRLQLKELPDEISKWTKDAGNPVLRQRALELGSHMKIPGYEDLLYQGLFDQSSAVKNAATDLVSQLISGNHEHRLVPQIVANLKGDDAALSQMAANLLLHSGVKDPHGVLYSRYPLLQKNILDQLKSEDAVVRNKAIQNLSYVQVDGKSEIFARVASELANPDPQVRAGLTNLLVNNGFDEARANRFLYLLKDSDSSVRYTFGYAITNLLNVDPEAKIYKTIVKNLKSRDPVLRSISAVILSNTNIERPMPGRYRQDPLVHEIFFKDAMSKDPAVQSVGMGYFHQIDLSENPKAGFYLKELSKIGNSHQKGAIITIALRNPIINKSPDLAFFLSHYKDADPIVSSTVISGLSDEQMLSILKTERDPKVLESFISRLTTMKNNPTIRKILLAGLESNNVSIQNMAIAGLGKDKLDKVLFERFKGIYQQEGNSALRSTALQVIFYQGDARSQKFIADALKNETVPEKRQLLMNQFGASQKPLVSKVLDKKIMEVYRSTKNVDERNALGRFLVLNSKDPKIAELLLTENFKNPLALQDSNFLLQRWAKRFPDIFPEFVKDQIIAGVADQSIGTGNVANLIKNKWARDPDLIQSIKKSFRSVNDEYTFVRLSFNNPHYDHQLLEIANNFYANAAVNYRDAFLSTAMQTNNAKAKLSQELFVNGLLTDPRELYKRPHYQAFMKGFELNSPEEVSRTIALLQKTNRWDHLYLIKDAQMNHDLAVALIKAIPEKFHDDPIFLKLIAKGAIKLGDVNQIRVRSNVACQASVNDVLKAIAAPVIRNALRND